MSYDKVFFKRYANYLLEPVVRAKHDQIFNIFGVECAGNEHSVIDLGCGLGEYQRYGTYLEYIGFDRQNNGHPGPFVAIDYTDLKTLEQALPFVPSAFVSLFSIEACYPAPERYSLYEKLFNHHPFVQCALVSGFYYTTHAKEPTVREAGGIVSYQTIEQKDDYLNPLFTERRIVMPVPSAMFGPSVIEVWKILERR